MLPPGTFENKVVLVTGGGTGLGKGMSMKFAELGAKVAICSRRLPVLEAAAKEITSAVGGEVLPVQLDIRDPEAVTRAVDTIEAQLGLPTVVVHNAAGNFISPTERLSPNAFQTIIDIVLKGTGFLTLDVGKRMIAKDTGGVFLAITTHYTINECLYRRYSTTCIRITVLLWVRAIWNKGLLLVIHCCCYGYICILRVHLLRHSLRTRMA